MSPREVCFLLDAAGRVLWSDEGSAAALPDSRARWEAIWASRADLHEVAHSHPRGPAGFSATDRRTMAALDLALGRALSYSVVSPAGTLRCRGARGLGERVEPEPVWAEGLRARSGMLTRPGAGGA